MKQLVSHYFQHLFIVCLLFTLIGIGVQTFFSQDEKSELRSFNTFQEKYPTVDVSSDRDIYLLKLFLEEVNREEIEKLVADSRKYLSSPQQFQAITYTGFSSVSVFEYIQMCVRFFVTFVILSLLLIYFSQLIALIQFIFEKSDKDEFTNRFFALFRSLKEDPKQLHVWKRVFLYTFLFSGSLLFSIMMFTPAYVSAYALKINIVGNSIFIVILLSLCSNTILILFIQKFYFILRNESFKGYVLTAKLKGMDTEYVLNRGVFKWKALIHPVRSFQGHLFQHIYQNSLYQSIRSVKEAIPLIMTSVIIVEMALNIQGSLGYELLKHLNRLHIDMICISIFFLFFTVKSVELITDIVRYKVEAYYEN